MGNPEHTKIGELLQTEEETANGYFLAQMFINSLIARVGSQQGAVKLSAPVLGSLRRQAELAHAQLTSRAVPAPDDRLPTPGPAQLAEINKKSIIQARHSVHCKQNSAVVSCLVSFNSASAIQCEIGTPCNYA